MVSAQIGWGLRGKKAGSHDEYSVLASGGPAFGKGDFATIFSRFSPGNPPAGREGPGALPWSVLSVFRDVQEQHYLGLTVQDWSNDTDAAGRPISFSRCFAVPYRLVAEHRISYRALSAILAAAELPPDGSPLDVELPETPEEVCVGLVERFGFERVAAVAALLLEGPVTVTHAEELSPRDRVDFFDAVAALLPCGWRTRFTASTWHNDGSHRLQLAFARQRRAETAELDWRTPRMPTESVVGGDYWSRLNELTKAREVPLATIVVHLASQTRPLAGAEPSEAVHIFADLDRPRTILKAARDGRVDPEDLRWLFTSGRFRELRAVEERAYLFDRLIALADVNDLPLVERLWTEAGGTLESLIRAARTDLRRHEPSEERSHYVGAAERLGLADAFLAGLIRHPGQGEEPGWEVPVARLVLTRSRMDYAETFQALAANTVMLCHLLCELASTTRADLGSWFRQLSHYVPADFYQPFFRLLHGDNERPVNDHDLSRLLLYGNTPLHALLLAAEVRGRLDRVLPEFAVLAAGETALATESWSDRITELSPENGRARGMLDALLLRRGRRPRHLEVVSGDWRGYPEGFIGMCGPQGAAAEPVEVPSGLVSYLREGSWPRHPEKAAAVLGLAAAYPEAADLASTVLAARASAPELIDDERYFAWRQEALERHPPLAGREPELLLISLPHNAPLENAVRLCVELLRRGIPAKKLAEHLSRSQWRLTGERLVGLATGIRGSLLAAKAGEELARSWSLSLVKEIKSELRSVAARHARAEVEYHTALLEAVLEGKGENVLQTDDYYREGLNSLAARLKRVADATKPKGRWR